MLQFPFQLNMVRAKCYKCGAGGVAETFKQARALINHSLGLSRGIKCGDSYNCIQEIKDDTIPTKPITTKTDEGTYHKVEGKSTKNLTVDEEKPKTTSSFTKQKPRKSSL